MFLRSSSKIISRLAPFSDLIPGAHRERFESRLRKGTGAVLQMLADTGNRATFFSCGWNVDHHPEVLREAAATGHEIAAQGYYQHSVLDISPAAFGEDLRRSREPSSRPSAAPCTATGLAGAGCVRVTCG